ncbi:hypothetical protein LPB137_10425 [Poseidonibacter parvus]|uniref:DUF218 domain-containing protein n=1 Tax=Poseidonibacter parvus TaxID=1850254 RepID=A0A1P8KNV1_9BACT|nr:ElyC/SanA/YdcF family protein [Poseidonibacter parvus]APW66230.1 hypothetical protein LPB137_10425 [Poseidonibacter parvus]
MSYKILTLGFFICIFVYLFTNLGNYLDISKDPIKSDIIVSLGGGKNLHRFNKSIQLYKENYSKQGILIITGGTKYSQQNNLSDNRIAHIKNTNQKINYIFNPYLKNTAEEILFIRNYLNENNLKSALLVTDSLYTRRISILSNLLIPKSDNLSINTAVTDLEWWNKSLFYENKIALLSAFMEFFKISYNYIAYGVFYKLDLLYLLEDIEEQYELKRTIHDFINKYKT